METWDAEKEFMKATGYTSEDREVEEFRSMLQDEIAYVYGKGMRYTKKVEIACNRILDWYNMADEVHWVKFNKLSSIREFVATTRRARVWATLLNKGERK